ncbi:hypothetical protein [Nitrosomonas supralitoralis]|uniref:Uncharacterized protein n=1 Tax=Nitrosomonas supralitoralis TaxID=2116706 RepID=A0A2P7NR90_9PROT|nr:hypothetical protein [Nitrosomonas supralitoralis]PSJ15949.1 hypothetical protein C7H79_16220 [Nitrosomonas supralitoralis]
MVFIWGVTLERESFGLGLEDKTLVNTKWGRITVEEAAVKSRLERKHHQYLSKLGLALIGVGFLLQLVAVWLVCY